MAGSVGILALQGDYRAHGNLIAPLAEPLFVRDAEQLEAADALIVPGGESTTFIKLIDHFGLREPLLAFAAQKPCLGTCAGAILFARDEGGLNTLEIMDINVVRNGYGRQRESFEAELECRLNGRVSKVGGSFIRAPLITRVGPKCRVLATFGGRPVLVEEERHIVTTFHPELLGDSSVHRYFLGRAGIIGEFGGAA